MLANVKLPFHPTVTDCLKWSADGELAIAAGEFVHLLFPRRGNRDERHPSSEPDPWVHLSFRINSYTREEWPSEKLSDLDSFSIGEEQSLSTVLALDWSPHGLAKHNRSALAVLTTNQVLSVWASASDPRIASTWERILVVNKSLEVFHQQIPSDGGYGLPNHDSQRRSCRVRSMSWALPKEVGRSNIESNGLQDSSASSAVTQYLAVTDDADEVAILMITSPWLHRGSLAWKAQVRCKASWEELKMLWFSNREAAATEVDASAMTGAEEAHWPSIFVDSMRKKAFIDRVMCRPCQSHQADLGLILRRGGQTLNFEVSLDVISNLSTINGRTPISFANKASPSSLYSPFFECGCATFPKKALKSSESNSGCIDTPNARTSLYVAVANAGAVEVYCFKSRKGSVEDAGTRTNDNDGSCTLVLTDGWDKISGLALTSTQKSDVSLYASGFLSGPWVFRTQSSPDGGDDALVQFAEPLRTTSHNQALAVQEDFDRQHDLGGLSFAKTWGLASWGAYVASCVSYHPGDMVEYNLTSGEQCHIFFGLDATADGSPATAGFPWQQIYDATDEENSDAVHTRILKLVIQQPLNDAVDRKVLYSICCAAVLSSDSQVIQLADEAFRQLAAFTGKGLEQELSLLDEGRNLNVSASQHLERLNQVLVSRSGAEETPSPDEWCDFCAICDQVVIWEDRTEAACLAGHQFGRCSLTFLPIKEPGVSKSCEACNREFLEESSLTQATMERFERNGSPTLGAEDGLQGSASDNGVYEDRQPDQDSQLNGRTITPTSTRPRLTKSLFATFDICPHCRGKYVG